MNVFFAIGFAFLILLAVVLPFASLLLAYSRKRRRRAWSRRVRQVETYLRRRGYAILGRHEESIETLVLAGRLVTERRVAPLVVERAGTRYLATPRRAFQNASDAVLFETNLMKSLTAFGCDEVLLVE